VVKRRKKTKKPFWQTFRLANEENLSKLPKRKPACLPDRAHNFQLPEVDGSTFAIGRCRYCKIRWIFRVWLEPNIAWKKKKSGPTLAIDN
jgi:hypothetical protein